MFLCLLVLSSSVIYSLDFGSKFVRLAKQKPGRQVEIVTNDQSSRHTPNYLAYISDSDEPNLRGIEWVVGVDAERAIRKNPSHGVHNPFNYLNNPKDYPLKNITPTEGIAIALTTYLKSFKRKNDKIIITVPTVFSPHARRNLMNAFKLIGISTAQIINSNSALAALYAVEKLPISDNVTKTVLFIDSGAIQTELSLFKFVRTNKSVEITLQDYRFTDEIGGDYIDDILFNWTLTKLKRPALEVEYPAIRRSVIKAKERLAAGSSTVIDVTEDFGQQITLTNDDVNTMCAEMINKFEKLIENITADEVELIGGCTRLPSLSDPIKRTFGESAHRSLNSDEAVALGAVYFGGIQSGLINGAVLHFIKPSLYGMTFETGGKDIVVFSPGDLIERKIVKIRKFTDFNVTLKITRDPTKFPRIKTSLVPTKDEVYADIQLVNLSKFTRSITSQIDKSTKPFLSFMFDVSQTLDSLDYISAALTANVTVNMTIENESINQVSQTSWKLATEVTYRDSEMDFNSSKTLLDGIRGYRRSIANHRKAFNDLMNFIIDMNEKLNYNQDMIEVTTEEERQVIKELLSRERQTVDLQGQHVSAEDLEKRKNLIKETIGSTLTKFDEFSRRPRAVADLQKVIAKAEKALDTATTDNDTINEVIEYINGSKSLIDDIAQMDNKTVPTITVKKINQRRTNLAMKITNLRSPPRKPKQKYFEKDPSAYAVQLEYKKNQTSIDEHTLKDNETVTEEIDQKEDNKEL